MKVKGLGIIAILYCIIHPCMLFSQEAYFIDGFHGGVWGHYPEGYTKYIVGQLNQHPDWKINLEIEPETWEREIKDDPEYFKEFSKIFADQSAGGRIEYINPAYAQSYCFNTSGESIIRQFYYGIKKLNQYFPQAVYTTYSSEEPCFTSALPQILTSFGFKYASLKNPNTCWGGYTRAHGGELVYWTGADGSRILTVPRYEFESLKPGSTWETIGNANSPEYINAAFDFGVKNPVGMCLQDAGWRWGPWLKGKQYKPSVYTTWRNYFENVADATKVPEWKFNQEDVLVSLVWGSQVLQRLAQEVRHTENNLLQAEKVAVMGNIENGKNYPAINFDEAWRQLLLAQHHDCWIVPYNGKKGETWADNVTLWTGFADNVSNTVIEGTAPETPGYIKVYNTYGYNRTDYVKVALNDNYATFNNIAVQDEDNVYPAVIINNGAKKYLQFKASVPAFGYKVFKVVPAKPLKAKQSVNFKQDKNIATVETDLYRIQFDTQQGGAITSLVAKKLGNKQFVDPAAEGQFSGLRGNFYKNGGMQTTFDKPATITVTTQGEDFIQLQLVTSLIDTDIIKTITLNNSSPRIDFDLKINWKDNIRVGSYDDSRLKSEYLKKAFYNDKEKLLTVFPLNLKGQRVYKNAPFDVMESKLDNTFFSTWDSIKNNLIVNWVDVTDASEDYGCALFTDHTTTYTHGKDFPLGLNVQYSGKGLWGRDYTTEGPTEIQYALLPHKGNWQEAQIWTQSREWEEPLRAELLAGKPDKTENSLIKLSKQGWDITSVEKRGNDIYMRIFNAEADGSAGKVVFNFNPGRVNLVALNGDTEKNIKVTKSDKNYSVDIAMPQFGFKTLKITLP